ncbi:MAG: Crp/Fnr family transcriptional regulator [Bdellovibrionales bacterium]|nr:Crp/Fnr family transcriptional regulator [Bdellovibrionales bacterium]
MFKELSPAELALLSRCKTSNHYKKKQVIFYEGNAPYGVHCVRKGKIKLFRTTPQGREQIVRLVSSGEAMGFKALLSSDNYSLTAEVLEDSEICFVDKKAFFEILDHSPKLARTLLETLADEVKSQEKTICSFSQKSVRERVAETVLMLNEKYGSRAEGGSTITIPLKREDIATLSGTVLESAVRYLSEFKKDGMIELKGREIIVRNSERLLAVTQNKLL